MIIRDKPGLTEILFAVRGSVLPHIAPALVTLVAISAGMVAFDHYVWPLPQSTATPFSIMGVALSLFLGFRNNAAYDRWWEARKLWGALLVDLRALSREADLFLPKPETKRLLRLGLAFAHLHRCQLRGLPPDAAARVWGDAPTAGAALDQMNAVLAEARHTGQLDGFGARTLSQRLASMEMNSAGGERIAATPLPYVYSLLIFRTIYLYCLLIPLALIGPEGWMTPLFTGLIAYVFRGLAEVTEDLSHPYGSTSNGLPLDAICRGMEISLAPHLDMAPPAPLKPQNYVLN
jgi:putative membrane protein